MSKIEPVPAGLAPKLWPNFDFYKMDGGHLGKWPLEKSATTN